jgi:YhcH/YjgK/YiaL family protein
MIIDALDNSVVYEGLGPGFAQAFAYLRSGRAGTDAIGRHALDGDDLFVNIEEYTTKLRDQGRWEAHRKYADVQYVVSGCERMGYAVIDGMAVEQAYDAEADVGFYTGNGVMLRVPAGTFTVFMPQDAHMPCIADGSPGEPGAVRKVVVKVRVNG